MRPRTRVAIESPYAGDIERNERFARAVCRYAVAKGHAPFAMHLLYPQFLDEDSAEERHAGIQCGLSWTAEAEEVWFCLRPDEELTRGMRIAADALDGRTGRVMRFDVHGSFVGEEELQVRP